MIPNSRDFAALLNTNHNDFVGSLKSLEADFYVESQTTECKFWNLTSEALYNVEHGTPEFRLFQLIPKEGVNKDELSVTRPIF